VADYALSVTAAKGRWVEISRATASSSATIDFTGIGSTYDLYRAEFYNVVPATTDAYLWLRTSTDNGSSYDSGASDYAYGIIYMVSPSSTPIGLADSTDAAIYLDPYSSISDSSYGGISGAVEFCNPDVAQYWRCRMEFSGSYDVSCVPAVGSGARLTAANVDAIRFLMSTGNIASGTFVLLGRKK
jgi:hypothetical protein